jgi:uncharacterized phage protein (TIGR01671 family)
MNKIKYRAYCRKTDFIYSPIDKVEWLISSEVIRATAVISEIEEHHMHNDYGGMKNFELDQYIGIRDIRNREIYENDYVKVNMTSNDYSITNFLGLIKYVEELASFTILYISADKPSKDIRKTLWNNDKLLYCKDDSEIEPIRIDPLLKMEITGNLWQSDIEVVKQAYIRDTRIDDILNN